MAEAGAPGQGTRGTLSRRLLLAALVWVALALVGTGVLLQGLFRAHIERRFDAQLSDHLEELVAAADVAASGDLVLSWRPADPRFGRPLSGWYWQIGTATGSHRTRSGSLGDTDLALDVSAAATARMEDLRGPGGVPLRARLQSIAYPDATADVVFVVAGPLSDIDGDVASLARPLVVTLTMLGLSLAGAALLQVRFGLAPLGRLERELAAVRRGATPRLGGDWPGEVAPLVTELNALLEHHATRLARARTEAGNLAHALKTPISILRNEISRVDPQRGRLLGEQLALVQERLERHLTRARAAGAVDMPGVRAPLATTVEDIRFSLTRLHAGRTLQIDTDVAPPALAFRGEADDLAEMLGNLLDNACKWARRQVRLSATGEAGWLRIRVEDDGPGIAAGDRERVLRRGRRLDETVPGSGLGLAITDELATLYGGALTLHDSPLGGLRVELRLPAAAES